MLQFRGPLCLWQCFASCSGVGFYLLSWVGCSWVGDQPATGELVPPAARTSSILPSTWTTSSLPQEQISASTSNIVVTIVTNTRCHKTNNCKIEHQHTNRSRTQPQSQSSHRCYHHCQHKHLGRYLPQMLARKVQWLHYSNKDTWDLSSRELSAVALEL